MISLQSTMFHRLLELSTRVLAFYIVVSLCGYSPITIYSYKYRAIFVYYDKIIYNNNVLPHTCGVMLRRMRLMVDITSLEILT